MIEESYKMNKILHTFISSLVIFLAISGTTFSQTVIDEVSAIVGDETIFLSDIENMVLQQISAGDRRSIEIIRCSAYEDMLVQLLFLDQARIDSIVVSFDNVNRMIDMRMDEFIMQAGSEEALEQYFNKSMVEIKRDLRPMMESQQLASEVQNNIAMDISITPQEVRNFYRILAADSLPLLPAKVEFSIIQTDPPELAQNKLDVRQKLLDMRRRIVEGESFRALAVMYSEDDGSASRGGELGFQHRSSLDKAYADEAFSLKKNQVSRVVESLFGFHIIEMIERKGDMINTRHILIRPKVNSEQAARAKQRLDSIADFIRMDSLGFDVAAYSFSTHKDSRLNGGKYVSEDTRESLIEIDKLPQEMYFIIRDMKLNEISEGFQMEDDLGNTVFRLLRLDKETEPHSANLKDDYNYIQEIALSNKRANTYQEWIEEKMELTYIKISDSFKTCKFRNDKWLK